ncbi:MAG: DUF1902 domain-containing protein [Oscillospiraceae bacterium]|nr:DUF1902 domain-containing protein [Oscillospiraceae bacterium]
MSKYDIFVLGVALGAVLIAFALRPPKSPKSVKPLKPLQKGRVNMQATTSVLEKTRIYFFTPPTYGGIAEITTYTVNLKEDDGVWIATSEDVPGLVLESETIEDIEERVWVIAPDLLRLNGVQTEGGFSLVFQKIKSPPTP